jgi:hypothetical protein
MVGALAVRSARRLADFVDEVQVGGELSLVALIAAEVNPRNLIPVVSTSDPLEPERPVGVPTA